MPSCATRCVTSGLIAAVGAGVAGAGVNVWTPVGPAGSAWLQAFAVDPQAPDTLYAGFPGDRGIWKSRDGGEHWFECNTGIAPSDPWIIGLAVHPSDPGTVITDPWDPCLSNPRGTPCPESSLLTSSDRGSTWRRAANPIYQPPRGMRQVWELGLDPSDPSTVLAAGVGEAPGLYRSTDGGKRFAAVGGTGAQVWPNALVAAATTPATFYLGTSWNSTLGSLPGIWRSRDTGSTWQRIVTGLPAEAGVSDIEIPPPPRRRCASPWPGWTSPASTPAPTAAIRGASCRGRGCPTRGA